MYCGWRFLTECARAVVPGARKGHIMPRQTSTGTCTFCQGTFSKGTMTRHLSACKQRQAALQASATGGTGRPTKILHLLVDGYGPYWLHLEVRADARLDTLDTFLRNIWLECCGHMSQFCINGEDYVSGAARELGARTMNIPLEKVFAPGMTCTYEYDFGTTTETQTAGAGRTPRGKAARGCAGAGQKQPASVPVCGVRSGGDAGLHAVHLRGRGLVVRRLCDRACVWR